MKILSKAQIQGLFADHDTPATVLLTALSDWFGRNAEDGDLWLSWDELRLMQELLEDFGDCPPAQFSRICAGRIVVTQGSEQAIANSLDMFTAIVSGLCGNHVWQAGEESSSGGFSAVNPDVDDVLWAIVEMKLLMGERFPVLGPDIKAYIGELFSDEGMTMPGEFEEYSEEPESVAGNAVGNLEGDSDLGYAIAAAGVEQEADRRKALLSHLTHMFDLLDRLGYMETADSELRDTAYQVVSELVGG